LSSLPTQKRLAIILALDMAGFSARSETDEAGALEAVQALHGRVKAIADARGGRVFNTAGDGLMLEFSAASEALAAALELLTGAPDAPPIRIGIHVGEVSVRESGDLLGHGVNVAARLEALAQPGMALVSEAVANLVRGGLRARLAPRGRVTLDKMAETMAVLALDPSVKPGTARPLRRRRPWIALAVASAAAIAALFAVVWSIAGREATVRATTREVMIQLAANGEGNPEVGDAALSAVVSLRDSPNAADRAAFSFLRRGDIVSAVTTLERFGEELAGRGASKEASAAFSRASLIGSFDDQARALRNARRAYELAPQSYAALDAVAWLLLVEEGEAASLAFLEGVLARQSQPTAFRAFVHLLIAERAFIGGRSDAGLQHLQSGRDEAAAFPDDAFLQAYVMGVRVLAAFYTDDLMTAVTLSDETRRRFALIPGEEWRFSNWSVLARERAGDWEGAWTLGRALIAERERQGVQPSESTVGMVCYTGLGLGYVAQAAPYCRASAELAEIEYDALYLLADLAGSEGRIDDARRYVDEADARAQTDPQAEPYTSAYFAVALGAYADDFQTAEANLERARRVIANGPESERPHQTAFFTRWLGLREVAANRLLQGCALLEEAAGVYLSVGAELGAEASRQAMRDAGCPAR